MSIQTWRNFTLGRSIKIARGFSLINICINHLVEGMQSIQQSIQQINYPANLSLQVLLVSFHNYWQWVRGGLTNNEWGKLGELSWREVITSKMLQDWFDGWPWRIPLTSSFLDSLVETKNLAESQMLFPSAISGPTCIWVMGVHSLIIWLLLLFKLLFQQDLDSKRLLQKIHSSYDGAVSPWVLW